MSCRTYHPPLGCYAQTFMHVLPGARRRLHVREVPADEAGNGRPKTAVGQNRKSKGGGWI